ncbi:hypothetical protein K488DRAFT_86821 [Vararia minispora EC-137]|uniref:Uncharacterized protein n=1 Tax=Vararia minispora EC-137 TaxID=1314806 RepID=A0ACB8QJE8_9AGAM|nr:hypothetical protein K488DRAFT_86821 [Vararia minispora EC-137]
MLAVMNSNNSSCISFSDPAFHHHTQPKVQVIALEECAPPPRPSHPPTTFYSDSYCSGSSSTTNDESEDEACSSYCSSDDAAPDATTPTAQYIDDTFRIRMYRVQSWRDAIPEKTTPSNVPMRPTSPTYQKRKADEDEEVEGVYSAPSPRKHPRSTHSLGALSCPACDADFASALGLRMHGRASSSVNDACRVAVEYGFE